MSDIRDFFIKSLDEAESGINALMGKLMSKVGRLDPGVKEVLDKQGIRPQYFSFRYTGCDHNKIRTSISNFILTPFKPKQRSNYKIPKIILTLCY